MSRPRIFGTSFSAVYPLAKGKPLDKVLRSGRAVVPPILTGGV